MWLKTGLRSETAYRLAYKHPSENVFTAVDQVELWLQKKKSI